MIVIPAVVPDQLLLSRFNYLLQTQCLLYHRRQVNAELGWKVEVAEKKEPDAEKKEPDGAVEEHVKNAGKVLNSEQLLENLLEIF
jgi:hypothetical protein